MSLRFTLRNTTSDRHVTMFSNIQLGNFELIGSDGLRGGKILMQFTIEMDGSDFCLIFCCFYEIYVRFGDIFCCQT